MAATEDRLVELWKGRHQVGDEHRKLYEERWIRNWQWYRNVKSTSRIRGQQWRSNRQIPDAFRVIETMVPQHVIGMFRNRNWFSVDAPQANGLEYAKMAKALLLHGWRMANGYSKTITGVKMGNILGHFVPKTTWRVSVGERVVLDIAYEYTSDGERVPSGFKRVTTPDITYNGPDIEFPDLFNLWQDPTGQGTWWIERIPSSYDHLKVENAKFGGRLYKNMAKLSARVAMSKATGAGRAGTPSTLTNSGNTPPLAQTVDGIPEYAHEDAVELWQCWGYVSPSIRKYDDTQWRLQVIADGDILIRDVPAPTHNHRPAYDNVQSIPIPGQIYGDSVLSYVGDLIDLRSEFENMRRDEVMLNMYGTYYIDGRVEVRGQDGLKKPGGAVKLTPYDQNMDVSRAIGLIPRQPVLPEAYQESGVKERQILDTAGATEPFQGTAFGGRTTATEVNLIANIGQSRFALATMWMDENFKRPVLERMFGLYQSRLTYEQALEISGEPGLRGAVDFSDLRHNIHIYVDSGLFGSMDAQQSQQIIQLASTMMSDPETRMYLDPGKLIEALAYRMGVTGGDSFVRSQDEVAAIQQQQQQQQLLQAALGGMQDVPGAA